MDPLQELLSNAEQRYFYLLLGAMFMAASAIAGALGVFLGSYLQGRQDDEPDSDVDEID